MRAMATLGCESALLTSAPVEGYKVPVSVRALSSRRRSGTWPSSGGRTRRNNATLEEVAPIAGVSRATVSRVVNGSPRVSPDVRLDVQAAIEQLGYTPNRAARSLVTRRSDSVAVVITQPTGQVFSDPFFPRLLRGISSAPGGARPPADPADARVACR